MTYPTVKHVLISLYWFPTKASSSFIPDTYALAKFDRSSYSHDVNYKLWSMGSCWDEWVEWTSYVVHKIANATESEDEEINLLDQQPLAWLIVRVEIRPQTGSCHGV